MPKDFFFFLIYPKVHGSHLEQSHMKSLIVDLRVLSWKDLVPFLLH